MPGETTTLVSPSRSQVLPGNGPENTGPAQPHMAYRAGPAPSRPAKIRQGQALLCAGKGPPPCAPRTRLPPSLMVSQAWVLSLHWQGYIRRPFTLLNLRDTLKRLSSSSNSYPPDGQVLMPRGQQDREGTVMGFHDARAL